MRYLRQNDLYSCSAVALLNLDKWRGLKVTRKNLAQYKALCQANVITGTKRKQFERIVGSRGRKLSYENLKKHDGVIILETHIDFSKHCYLVIGWSTDGNRFGWLAVNYISGKTYSLISPSTMRWVLKHSVSWKFKK